MGALCGFLEGLFRFREVVLGPRDSGIQAGV